jgi:hypothetical protein
MISEEMYRFYLVTWVVCVLIALWSQRKIGSGAGLTISYVLLLWMLHWLAASIYVLPWYDAPDAATSIGLQESTYGIAGFVLGAVIIVPIALRRYLPSEFQSSHRIPVDGKLVQSWLAIGIVTYFILEPRVSGIPTVGAIASATSNLLLVAIAIECWNGLQRQPPARSSFWRWILMSAMLPITTVVTKGFIGYGFASMLTVFAFVASFYRPRWKVIAFGVLTGYLALSLYVTYMRDRKDIRAVVWGGEGYSSRFSTISRTLTQFEFLDIHNPDHIARIDERLNQNYLVGRAVEFLDRDPDAFARGRTLWEAVIAPIPRALWPTKPVAAGSGDLVSEFTGLAFARDTSVGIGHVLEWYVNFGAAGVFFGMAFMGVLVGCLDRMAASRLYAGDPRGFLLWWLPGIGLLQVGGSLVDAAGSASAGVVIAVLIMKFQSSGRARRAALQAQPAYASEIPRLNARRSEP